MTVARRAVWERLMSVAGCGCAGGFIASALGHYLGAPEGASIAGAALFAAAAAWIEFGGRRKAGTDAPEGSAR